MNFPTDDAAREAFFGTHAASYRLSTRHAQGADLDRLLDRLDLAPEQTALDLATGAGHVAVRLARQGLAVRAADPTAAMLEQARTLAREAGVAIGWDQTAAEHLPYADGQFDRVVCRRAAHHFADLPQALAEAHRVLRPEGLLGVSDMTAPALSMAALNHLEQARDPSHRQARTPDEWMDLILGAGFRLQWLEVTVEPMTPEQWLSPVQSTEAAGQAAFTAMASWSPAVRQALEPGGVFLKYRLLLVAVRPD